MAVRLLDELISTVDNAGKDPVSFRISYYPFIGRVGPLRASAICGGIAFEDEIISFDEQGKAKLAGDRRWSGLPECTIYDNKGKKMVTMGQSNSILRYIGSLCGQYDTSDPLKAALMNEVMDSTEDVIIMMIPLFIANHIYHNKDVQSAEVKKLSASDKLPFWLKKFENRLNENEKRGNKNGFIVGDTLSVADLKLYYQLYRMYDENEYDPGIKALFNDFPRLVKYIEKLSNMEGVKKCNDEYRDIQKDNKDNGTRYFRHEGKFIPGEK